MFAAERRRKIKEFILEYKHADMSTLCSLMGVSIATVRRDLEQLEAEGFLTKEHGGAILAEQPAGEVTLNADVDHFAQEKDLVGQIAANILVPGEAVFIGAGSTCISLARHIEPNTNLIVVTNNIHVVLETAHKPGISTVLLGGDAEVVDGRISTCGLYAQRNAENMCIDKAFISAEGATIQSGYTVASREQAMLNRLIMDRATETIMLADYSKFGKRAFVPLAPLDRFKRVVSNIQLGNEFKEYFYDHNVKLFISVE
jgi:DeoR/GlpR family transcriptional regulator of sugar metabolism